MAVIQRLLTERLRPKTLKDIILLERVRNSIGDEGELGNHLLLSGSPGLGKTTLAKCLASTHPTLYINVSQDRGIDTVKEEITEFCATQSISFDTDNSVKIVIMDEIDGATDTFFKALRATMERFSDNVRFIATCNYLQKVPPAIQSRFLLLKFDPENKAEEDELIELYKKRVKMVTDKLKIEWENDAALNEYVKINFPDLRKTFSKIQDFQIAGIEKIKLSDIKNFHYTFKDLFQLMVSAKDPHTNYKVIMNEYQNKINDIITSITLEFPDWLKENHPDKVNKLAYVLVETAEWDYKKSFMIDVQLALLALVYRCQEIFGVK